MTAAIVLAVSALLIVYPFALYPLILRALPIRPVQKGGADFVPPSASLLFCAFNEGRVMPAKIDNLRMLKARYPSLEILAYDDGSGDDTAIQLAEAGDVLTLVTGTGRCGKAHGMKRLAAMATGDVLIFTDANVQIEEAAIERLLGYYADSGVGGVLGSLHYEGSRVSGSALVGGLYWRIEEWLKDAESRTGNVMGADGSIFSVRRALYPDFPDDVLDDLVVSMSVVFAGKRLVKARDVVAWERMVSDRDDEVRRKVRIAGRSWLTHSYLRPRLRRMHALDRFKYTSRKLVRWFGGLWIITGLMALVWLTVATSHPMAYALISLGSLLVIGGYISRRGPLAAAMDIVIAYFATLRGILMAMRGERFTTWTPAKSRT